MSASVASTTMVVLAHPTPGSHCHQLAGLVCQALAPTNGIFHDLYAEQFDPVLLDDIGWDGASEWGNSTDLVDPMVERHRIELAQSTALVVVHPDWWGRPPAMMSGWIDRVLMPTCREAQAHVPALQRILVINTVGEATVGIDDPLGMVWRQGIGPHLPTSDLERMVLGPTATTETALRAAVARAMPWVLGGQR